MIQVTDERFLSALKKLARIAHEQYPESTKDVVAKGFPTDFEAACAVKRLAHFAEEALNARDRESAYTMLGFMQGVLWVNGWATIADFKKMLEEPEVPPEQGRLPFWGTT